MFLSLLSFCWLFKLSSPQDFSTFIALLILFFSRTHNDVSMGSSSCWCTQDQCSRSAFHNPSTKRKQHEHRINFQRCNGEVNFLTVIPGLSRICNQLWAIYSPMRRAFKEGFRHVIIETDNYEAYQVIKNFNNGAPAALYHLVNQIAILINNNTWVCTLSFIYAARNIVGRYAARLGMEVGDHLYTLEHPVTRVSDLLAHDKLSPCDVTLSPWTHDKLSF